VLPRASSLFKHALVQDIAYSMLLLGLRRSLHGQIARALEERFRDAMEGRPETLPHHFTEAGLFEKAVGYWCRADRQSVAKSGFVEAITQLRTGLRLIADLPDTRERKQRELEIQIALAGALTVVGTVNLGRQCACADRSGRVVGWDEDIGSRPLRRVSVPGRDHRPCRLAVLPLPPRAAHG
jgi:hypothetical protein